VSDVSCRVYVHSPAQPNRSLVPSDWLFVIDELRWLFGIGKRRVSLGGCINGAKAESG
jgi:hypothetical protein